MIATKKELMGVFSDTIILLSLACNVHDRLRQAANKITNSRYSLLHQAVMMILCDSALTRWKSPGLQSCQLFEDLHHTNYQFSVLPLIPSNTKPLTIHFMMMIIWIFCIGLIIPAISWVFFVTRNKSRTFYLASFDFYINDHISVVRPVMILWQGESLMIRSTYWLPSLPLPLRYHVQYIQS